MKLYFLLKIKVESHKFERFGSVNIFLNLFFSDYFLSLIITASYPKTLNTRCKNFAQFHYFQLITISLDTCCVKCVFFIQKLCQKTIGTGEQIHGQTRTRLISATNTGFKTSTDFGVNLTATSNVDA